MKTLKTSMKFLMCLLIALALAATTSCKKDSLEDAVLPETFESEQAATGTNGQNGDNGQDGDQGEQGETGSAGTNGNDGDDGENGSDGSDGSDGQDGADGLDGTQGEQGETGAQGPSGSDGAVGPAGANGINGTNGQDGEDGNANVRTFTYDLTNFSGDKHDQRVSGLTQEVLEDDVVLGYLKRTSAYYPIPTSNLGIGVAGKDLDIQVEIIPNVYTMEFFNSDTNKSWPVNRGSLKSLKIIIIKSTSNTTGKSAKIEILSKLKANGIDVNDYFQVMDYFGLEY